LKKSGSKEEKIDSKSQKNISMKPIVKSIEPIEIEEGERRQ